MTEEQIKCCHEIIRYINAVSGDKNSWQKIKKEILESSSPLLLARIFETGFLLSGETNPEKYNKHLRKLYKLFGNALILAIQEHLPPQSEEKFIISDKKKSKKILLLLAHQLAKGGISVNKLEPVVKKLCGCFDFQYSEMYVYDLILNEYNFILEN